MTNAQFKLMFNDSVERSGWNRDSFTNLYRQIYSQVKTAVPLKGNDLKFFALLNAEQFISRLH